MAGAGAEAGAMQASEVMHDLKTGHLLNANPHAQFIGMLLESVFGAITSTFAYLLYSAYYDIPGHLFQVPTAFIWIYAARLFNGGDLPERVFEFASSLSAVFVIVSILRLRVTNKRIRLCLPGGIPFAIGKVHVESLIVSTSRSHTLGMYNAPSFTLARVIGGVIFWYGRR